MEDSLHWNTYRSFEEELIGLSKTIHIDDKQLDVYSVKIADLLVAVCVEIESISKVIYFREGGEKNDDNKLYFDTDCLDFLNKKWLLDKRLVNINTPSMYLKDQGHTILKPLHNANRCGRHSVAWKRAYQTVKHNRRESLEAGNVRNFIQALGALFLLNIYFNDLSYTLDTIALESDFDSTQGSDIFSIKVHPCHRISSTGQYDKSEDFDECTYLIKPTERSQNNLRDLYNRMSSDLHKEVASKVTNDLLQSPNKLANLETAGLMDLVFRYNQELKPKVDSRYDMKLAQELRNVQFEAVLNKNQF